MPLLPLVLVPLPATARRERRQRASLGRKRASRTQREEAAALVGEVDDMFFSFCLPKGRREEV